MKGDFEKAYAHTMGHEGGYANHKKDRGGETYKGVARNIWRHWKGWAIIDSYKTPKNLKIFQDAKSGSSRTYRPALRRINVLLAPNKQLQSYVKNFYKRNFWDRAWCEKLPTPVALKCFNASVHMGVKWGVKLLQRALNSANVSFGLFEPLADDGVIGKKTMHAINALVERGGDVYAESIIIDHYCLKMRDRYENIIRKNPSQERWRGGWMKRARYRGV